MSAKGKITRLSTKGQVIIPKEVREHQGWDAGVELLVEEQGNTVVLRSAKADGTTTLRDLLGITGYQGPRLSQAEMEEGIARGARERT